MPDEAKVSLWHSVARLKAGVAIGIPAIQPPVILEFPKMAALSAIQSPVILEFPKITALSAIQLPTMPVFPKIAAVSTLLDAHASGKLIGEALLAQPQMLNQINGLNAAIAEAYRRVMAGFARTEVEALRSVGFNGSYLVIRQLEQDVAGFNSYCETGAARLKDRLPPPYSVTSEFIAANCWAGGEQGNRFRLTAGLTRGYRLGVECDSWRASFDYEVFHVWIGVRAQ